MKKAFSFALILAGLFCLFVFLPKSAHAAGDISINVQNFPDLNFRDFVSAKFDTDHNGSLSPAERAAVTNIDVPGKAIFSLTGIKYFPGLVALDCSGNYLSSLDLSGNTSLVILNCNDNLIETLQISACTNLVSLSCENNKLKNLDFTDNPNLSFVNCARNSLTSLKVTPCPYLLKLECGKNELKSLNVTKNPKLYHLDCRENYLTKLTVKYCVLTYLCCADNNLTALDVSTQTKLETLECPMNKIASLNLSNNTALKTLECGNNRLTSLDLTKCTMLKLLYCYSNGISSLDISKCKSLTSLVCYENSLDCVDISDIPGLYEMCWFGTRQDNGDKVEFIPVDTSNYDIAVYDLTTEIISMKAPTLSASSTPSGIKLSWTSSSGAADYEIEREEPYGTYTLLYRRIMSPTADTDAEKFSYNMYRVRARVSGTYSDYSNTAKALYNPFTDVSESASYFEAVMWAARPGFVSGTTKTTFSPDAPCKRYQFAVMLYKFKGKPDIGSVKLPFTDVPKTASYYKAVAWAYTNGIIKGTTKTTFSPNDTITRYQAVQMLYKFKGKPDIGPVTNPFKDVKSSDSYYSAVMWACENGITKGTSSTTFSPNAECKRYQLVVFLYKVFQRYAVG